MSRRLINGVHTFIHTNHRHLVALVLHHTTLHHQKINKVSQAFPYSAFLYSSYFNVTLSQNLSCSLFRSYSYIRANFITSHMKTHAHAHFIGKNCSLSLPHHHKCKYRIVYHCFNTYLLTSCCHTRRTHERKHATYIYGAFSRHLRWDMHKKVWIYILSRVHIVAEKVCLETTSECQRRESGRHTQYDRDIISHYIIFRVLNITGIQWHTWHVAYTTLLNLHV